MKTSFAKPAPRSAQPARPPRRAGNAASRKMETTLPEALAASLADLQKQLALRQSLH